MRYLQNLKGSPMSVFTFWGAFDALYLLAYYALSSYGNNGVYVMAEMVWSEPLMLILWPFLMMAVFTFAVLLLSASMIFSCFMFLMRWPSVRHVVNLQVFLLFLITCDLALLAYVSGSPSFRVESAAGAVVLFILLIARSRAAKYIENYYEQPNPDP